MLALGWHNPGKLQKVGCCDHLQWWSEWRLLFFLCVLKLSHFGRKLVGVKGKHAKIKKVGRHL